VATKQYAKWLDDAEHGPLPAILLVLTVVTGLVDAVSILALGRVFVANMTGNVVFVAFAIAGAPGFSLAASAAALAGFVVGALAAGRLIDRHEDRPTLIRTALLVDLVFVTAAMVIAFVAGHDLGPAARDVVAAILALALGSQNAIVRQLKVPDLTTTVLTMTLTGIAADVRSQPRHVIVRRVLAVLTMFGGAAVGAVLVLHTRAAYAFLVADALVLAALGLAWVRRTGWS
jgi:uncharacterized membrane protein YoaK (UPF0700 family)